MIVTELLLLFKSNSTDLKKGADEARDTTKKLNQDLDDSHKFTNQLGDSFTELAAKFSGLILGFVSADTLFEGLKSTEEYTKNLYFLSESFGVNAQAMDAWGRVIEKNGGTAQQFQNTLLGLQSKLDIGNIRGNSPLDEIAAKSGILLKDNKGQEKDPFIILTELSKKLHGMTGAQARALGREWGLDPATLLTLRQGPEAIKQMLVAEERLYTVQQQDLEVSKKFNAQWIELHDTFRGLYIELNTDFLPTLISMTATTTKFVSYLAAHKEAVKGFFIGLGAAALGAGIALAFAAGPITLATAAALGLAAAFSFVYVHADTVHNALLEFADSVGDRWAHTTELMSAGIERVINVVKKLWEWRDKLHDKIWGALGFDVTHHLNTANQVLHTIQRTPLAPANATVAKATRAISISVGAITVHTQATDANRIASTISDGLMAQLRQAVIHFDDGRLS